VVLSLLVEPPGLLVKKEVGLQLPLLLELKRVFIIHYLIRLFLEIIFFL
jgi:hypothetical protein